MNQFSTIDNKTIYKDQYFETVIIDTGFSGLWNQWSELKQ